MTASTDLVVLELAFIVTSISEGEPALSLFLSIFVTALISGAIWPRFDTMTVLLVIEPLALVIGAIRVGVGAHALSLVVDPLALVDITICMD